MQRITNISNFWDIGKALYNPIAISLKGTIHLRRWQIFTILDPNPLLFFTTIRWQIWQIFDPSSPKK